MHTEWYLGISFLTYSNSAFKIQDQEGPKVIPEETELNSSKTTVSGCLEEAASKAESMGCEKSVQDDDN